MELNVFAPSVIYCYFCTEWAATKPDCPLLLNMFAFSHFPTKLVPFTALNHCFHYFDVTKWPLYSPQNGLVLKIQIRVLKKKFMVDPDAAVLVVALWAGVAGHAELQFLHLLAFLTLQKVHSPHLSLRRTLNAVLSQNNLSDLFIPLKIGPNVFYRSELSVLKSEKEEVENEK